MILAIIISLCLLAASDGLWVGEGTPAISITLTWALLLAAAFAVPA